MSPVEAIAGVVPAEIRDADSPHAIGARLVKARP